MLIGRVIGEVVATCKHPSHEERKALVIQGLDLDGSDSGPSFVALDAVDAGVGHSFGIGWALAGALRADPALAERFDAALGELGRDVVQLVAAVPHARQVRHGRDQQTRSHESSSHLLKIAAVFPVFPNQSRSY